MDAPPERESLMGEKGENDENFWIEKKLKRVWTLPMKTLSLLAPSNPASWLPRDTRTCIWMHFFSSIVSHFKGFILGCSPCPLLFPRGSWSQIHLWQLQHPGGCNFQYMSNKISSKYRRCTCLLQSTMRGGLFEATAGSERMEWRNSATSRIFKMVFRCMLQSRRTLREGLRKTSSKSWRMR